MDIFLQQMANGVVIGLGYALAAAGLTLVFGILGILNFAHGEIFMLGAYGVLLAMQ
jgi:branched-chain amino acid transport system permease protein